MEIKDLKIVIDLKDLYTEYGDYDYGCGPETVDGEQDFNAVLKNEIQGKIINRIIQGFTPDVTKELKNQTIEKFKDTFEEKITGRIEKAIGRGVLVGANGDTFNVDMYAKEKLEQAINGNRHFLKTIESNVKAQIDEMQKALQDRYDLEFASGIIKNLKDGNLLKEGAEKLLLNDEKDV